MTDLTPAQQSQADAYIRTARKWYRNREVASGFKIAALTGCVIALVAAAVFSGLATLPVAAGAKAGISAVVAIKAFFVSAKAATGTLAAAVVANGAENIAQMARSRARIKAYKAPGQDVDAENFAWRRQPFFSGPFRSVGESLRGLNPFARYEF